MPSLNYTWALGNHDLNLCLEYNKAFYLLSYFISVAMKNAKQFHVSWTLLPHKLEDQATAHSAITMTENHKINLKTAS